MWVDLCECMVLIEYEARKEQMKTSSGFWQQSEKDRVIASIPKIRYHARQLESMLETVISSKVSLGSEQRRSSVNSSTKKFDERKREIRTAMQKNALMARNKLVLENVMV